MKNSPYVAGNINFIITILITNSINYFSFSFDPIPKFQIVILTKSGIKKKTLDNVRFGGQRSKQTRTYFRETSRHINMNYDHTTTTDDTFVILLANTFYYLNIISQLSPFFP